MTGGTTAAGLKHLGDLFGGGTAVGLGDGELLRRYAAARDASAFAALLARHGPMVAATCRAVLRDAHDAEDAFQATFLVLARRAGSIRAGDALAGWLHRVARRAAVQRSIEIRRRRRVESEALAMDVPENRSRSPLDPDELAILHEEVDRLPDRERLPVVLCDLQGQTYEQAADRLGWTVPALYHRLAAGRKRLRGRLMRRGITAAAAGGLVESSRNLAHAAPVPASWTASALAAATGGPVPASAATLAHTLLRSLLMTRLKFVAVGVLATAALVASGISAALAGRPDPPKAPRVADGPRTDDAEPARKVTLVVSTGELTNGTGMAGVRVTLRTWNPDKRTTASTDASGIARFQVAADCRYLVLHAEREGFVPAFIRWGPLDGAEPMPQQFRFAMEKAITISGKVVDQNNLPLAGATVVIDVDRAYPGTSQKVELMFRSTVTDPDGRWSFSCIPPKPDAIKVTAYHYLCLTEYTWFVPEEFQPVSALRDGSATLRLRRGTLVEGTVVGPDGRPVTDAEIIIGDNRRVGNLIPPIKADAQGRFTLGFKPGIATTLFARHVGFGPAMERIRIADDPKRVTLRLPAPRRMSVRVVDRNGKPLPNAAVSVRSWHGSESLDADFQPEGNGRFTWNDAPPDEVRISVGAEGHRGESNITIQPGQSIDVALGPERKTRIEGTVTDARTGRPVPRFTLRRGSVWTGRHLPAWYPVDAEAVKGPGRFEFDTREEIGDRVLLRAEAEGYLPEDFPIAAAGGKTQTHAFRLVPAGPIRGTLQKPDGSPAQGAFVYLETGEGQLRLDNGDFYRGEKRLRATTDRDGHFALPPQKDDYLLVAVSDAGYAIFPRGDVREGGAIRLQPWARIEGTYKLGGVPMAGVELHSFDDDYPPYDGRLHVQDYLLAKTDDAGHFVMPRVLSGRRVIRQRVPNNLEFRFWPVDLATVDAQGGRTVQLKIGESGRTVVGRFQIPTSSAWMVRKASIEPISSGNPKHPSIGVHITNDGRFRALDLPPGDYVMNVALHEPPPDSSCGWGRLVAAYRHEIHVSGGPDEGPLDLGDVQPAEIGGKPLAPGDLAPDFAVKTLDGQELKLSQFRGRYVLLDFWATWCAPCIAEMPTIDAIHKAHGADRRFAVVSLSLDDKPADAASFIKAQEYGWTQGHVGPDSPVVAAYGATAIPATFLIGPDGRILAAGLRGEKLKSTVAGVLDPPAAR